MSISENSTVRSTSAAVSVEPAKDARRATIGMAIVLVAQLMLVLDTTIVNVALPSIDAGLGFGPASLSWVLNSYTLAFGGLLLIGGRLGDVYGRLRLFELGLAIFTVSSLIGGMAQTPAWLVAARTVQGIGAALAAPGVLALLTASAPDEAARHRRLALFSAVGVGGGTLGLILGGVVTDLGSWRWTLFVNVPIGIVALALARRFVSETPRRRVRFDLVGAVSATGAAVSIVLALIDVPEHGWTSPRTIVEFAFGAVLLVVLTVTERRVEHPMLRPALFRSRARIGGLIVVPLVFGSQFAMFFLVVQYLQSVLGFGPLAAGAAFLPLTLGIFTMSRFTPRLVARFGQAPLLMVGTFGLAICFVWISNADTSSSYLAAVFGPMLLNGFSGGLTFMPAASLVVGGVEPEHAGSASGLLQTTQQLGGAVGLAVIVSVYAAGSEPGQFVPGLRPALLTTAAFMVLAFAVAAFVIRPTLRTPA